MELGQVFMLSRCGAKGWAGGPLGGGTAWWDRPPRDRQRSLGSLKNSHEVDLKDSRVRLDWECHSDVYMYVEAV